MKKIISFCLWGSNRKYTVGAIKNAELALEIYGDWICRFYCGSSVPSEIIDKLKPFDNCEVIIFDEPGGFHSTLWRFYPISENDVEIMISRDCDSRLSVREKSAVNEWEASESKFHIMRDHPNHGNPIMAGMFGVKSGCFDNITGMMSQYYKNVFGVDQAFLADIVYPLIKDDAMVHDEFNSYEKQRLSFPIKRSYCEFIGEVLDEFDRPNIDHQNVIKKYLKL